MYHYGSWICTPILTLGFWYIPFNENYLLIENHDLFISKYIWHGFNVLKHAILPSFSMKSCCLDAIILKYVACSSFIFMLKLWIWETLFVKIHHVWTITFLPFEHNVHRGLFFVYVWVCTCCVFVLTCMDLHELGSLHGSYRCMHTFLCDGHDLMLR